MPFNLFITSATGRTVKALRSPYPDRAATRRTVTTVIANGNAREERAFAERVVTARLGETVVHLHTAIAFRTEEI